MNSQKFLLATLAGTVVYFLLGWLIFGILLSKTMEANTAAGMMRPGDQMVWWALIAGNIVWAALLTYVIVKTGTTTMMGGATVGFTVGLLVGLAVDLMLYASTTMLTSLVAIVVDVLGTAVLAGAAGAVIAWVYHAQKKTVAVA